MSRLIDSWNDLLRQVGSSDFDEQQMALFQIGLILERHHAPQEYATDIYEAHLSRDLLRLVLSEERQADTLEYLIAMLSRDPEHAENYIYTMGRARPSLLINPLLELICEKGSVLSEDAAYEAVKSLWACLNSNVTTTAIAINGCDPSDQLDDWAESDHRELALLADRVLDRVEEFLGVD